ncbi:tyrosine-type recombinase/integrase [Amycolatopsis roodepoortensis]|uniref:tyrosine-type recombinase/integrase n=1 Tax=Amycolatopsis roodepoortensis TaxID=700274 RepID=UPI00214C921C|nr:tyrosine-type recombinase/integrase [Amycolatopsis roodepoortensis]UUV34416.1 tyrosine-type recombinase/integrase [Amycolatopsis roodepoortensis]
MARPRTEIGTYGKINVRRIRDGNYVASARYRLRNGRLKPVKRHGPSAAAAERRLKKAMTELANEAAGQKITGDTRFSILIKRWLADFERKVNRGERAHKSLYDYQDSAAHLERELGDLTCREAENVGICNDALKRIRDTTAKSKRSKGKGGYAATKRTRTVLTNICTLGVIEGAMETNPGKSVERVEQSVEAALDAQDVKVLEPEVRQEFLTKLRKYCDSAKDAKGKGVRGQAWADLPDTVEAMLATGGRPGEILALTGPDVDAAERTSYIGWHLVRVEGQGIVRKRGRKRGGRPVRPKYPSWAAPMFSRRKLAAGEGPLFPTWNGQWQDPGNVAKRIRIACDAIGYGWLKSMMLRHTVGTHLGDSGLSNEHVADQLGNTPDVVQRHYRRPKITNEKIADALENLLDDETG